MSNSKVRQLLMTDPTAMMKVMQKHGVKPIAGPYVSVSHQGFSVVEAPIVETVNNAVIENGSAQWNSVHILRSGLRKRV